MKLWKRKVIVTKEENEKMLKAIENEGTNNKTKIQIVVNGKVLGEVKEMKTGILKCDKDLIERLRKEVKL